MSQRQELAPVPATAEPRFEPHKVRDYLALPHVSVGEAVALGVALVTAAPQSAPQQVRDAARALRQAIGALESDLALRNANQLSDHRAERQTLARAWSGLQLALQAAHSLPEGARKEASEQVYQLLFGEGLAFVRSRNDRLWVEGRLRLAWLSERGLDQAVHIATGGNDHLDALTKAHHAFGAAIGISESNASPPEVNLLARLRDLRAAISAYALQILAWSQSAQADPKAVTNALNPIDRLRPAEARRRRARATATPAREDLAPDKPAAGRSATKQAAAEPSVMKPPAAHSANATAPPVHPPCQEPEGTNGYARPAAVDRQGFRGGELDQTRSASNRGSATRKPECPGGSKQWGPTQTDEAILAPSAVARP